MKTSTTCIAIILIAVLHPLPSRAQFLKTLMNNAKQTIAGKTTSQAVPATGTTTGATTGKPDSSARAKSAYDSTFLTQLMAKTNKPKPSISPADSAAAIKGFMTATGGSGSLYQYHVIYTFKVKNKDSTSSDTLSTAITDAHNARTDMGMLGMQMQVLGHAGMPHYSIILYPQNKTYVFNIIDTAAINSGDATTYHAVKIGNETVLGYNCIHSKLTLIIAGSKSEITEDLWTSPDVPGYALLKKLISYQHVTPKMMQALDKAGCDGFIVKMDMQSKGFSMDMQLITAERKTFPASMFEIPSGYTAANTQSMFANMMQQRQK